MAFENTPNLDAPQNNGTPSTQDFSGDDSSSQSIAQLFGISTKEPATETTKEDTPVEPETTTTKITSEPVPEDGGVTVPEAQPTPDFDNEQKRAAYWQSQHDKMKQDYTSLVNQLMAQRQEQEAEPEIDWASQVPPEPEEPVVPTNYSYSDAINTPDSASAKYHEQKERYEGEYRKWNRVKQDVSEKSLQSELQKYKADQDARSRNEQNKALMQQKYGEYITSIESNYGKKYNLSKDDAVKIVTDMSKPEAYNLDNVVDLWLLKNNRHPTQKQVTIPTKPIASPTMEQTRKAQSVPLPMGVQPATSETKPKENFGKSFMDIMIKRGNATLKL